MTENELYLSPEEINRRLENIDCEPSLRQKHRVFSFLREFLTNQKPEDAVQNLSNLRTEWPAEDNLPFIPRALTPDLENALRSGYLGLELRIVYLAGLMNSGEEVSIEEKKFVQAHCQRGTVDLGTCTGVWKR